MKVGLVIGFAWLEGGVRELEVVEMVEVAVV